MILKFLNKIGRKKVVLDRGPSHPRFELAKPWMNKVRSSLTPIIVDNFIFTVSNEGYFYVIDKKRGNVIRIIDIYKDYKTKKRKFIKPTGFSVSQNELYLSNNNGKLKVIEFNSGNVTNNIKISRDTISKPTIYKNNLFVIKNGAIIQYE